MQAKRRLTEKTSDDADADEIKVCKWKNRWNMKMNLLLE